MDSIRLALAQINPIAGDLKGNANRIIAYARGAAEQGAELVAFPELALSGYHPRDLLASRDFLTACYLELKRIAETVAETTVLVGLPLLESSTTNAAAVCSGGIVRGAFHKHHMPGLGTLGEARYFQSDKETRLLEIGDALVGVNMREDLWYIGGPAEQQCQAGATLIINMNAWPFVAGRSGFTKHLTANFASRCSTPVAFVNMAGASDELIFEGASLVMGRDGKLIASARHFVEDLLVVDVPLARKPSGREPSEKETDKDPDLGIDEQDLAPQIIKVQSVSQPEQTEQPEQTKQMPELPAREAPEPMNPEHALYSALSTGVLDFTEKGGYAGAMIVMDGGLASALAASIAADALGSSSVHALIPGGKSADTARRCAALLGIRGVEVQSAEATDATGASQRELGSALMDESAALGLLPLSSITKSLLATGGITLYGETAGLFAPLCDLWGADVMRLASWRNSMGEAIPQEALEDGSRGLEEDAALKVLVEDDLGFAEAMQAGGLGPAGLKELFGRLQAAEHLRRQAPPGPKVTAKAIGLDWALPLISKFDPETDQ